MQLTVSWSTDAQVNYILVFRCGQVKVVVVRLFFTWYNFIMRFIARGLKFQSLDHFDLIAPFYERVIKRVNLTPLLSLLQLDPTNRLLDVGGGTGRVSGMMTEQTGKVILTDVSCGMVREAATKDGLRPLCAHAERLPFPDAAFDRILMVDAFHHLRDQQAAAGEVIRVLRPGGRSVIEEPDIRLRGVKLVALLERVLLMRSRFCSIANLRHLFERAGARVLALDEGHDSAVRLVIGRHESHREGAR